MSTEPDKIETTVTLEVPAGYRENERLDVYLTRFIPNVSRSKVQQGIRQGMVTVSGRVVRRPSHPVQSGDVLVCRIMRPPPIRAEPEEIPLDILLEDEHLIVVNKPAGMVVHPAYGNRTGTLVNALLHHVGAPSISFEDADDEAVADDDEIGLSVVNATPGPGSDVSIRPGIVHRLDKDTSGVVVVAKSDEIHRGLARQFAERSIRRHYIALVRGIPASNAGRIETLIGRDPRDRKRMTVLERGRGKRAITHFEVVEAFDVASLVRFRLETGRTHQIRVHAAHIGHPVLADATYGGDRLVGSGTSRARLKNILAMLPRQALHAASLGFIHPAGEEEVYVEAPLPDDIRRALEALRPDIQP